MATNTAAKEAILADIAKKHLDIETLETRNSDGLDFHDLSVWEIRTALMAAFLAGQDSARSK